MLNRPVQPILFLKQLLENKLTENPAGAINGEIINEWIKLCYADASARVDEHGIIYDVPIPDRHLA